MTLTKKIAIIIVLLINSIWSLPAQIPEAIQSDQLDTPGYDIEIISIEKIGLPPLGPEEPLRYRYVLVWDIPEPKVIHQIYGASELDRMPLFEEGCITADNPEACSNEAVAEYFRENINYPDDALQQDQDGLEQLYFVLDEKGKIEGKIKVVSKDHPCEGCARAALNAAQKMPAWVPARKDGKNVKAKIILPVVFNTLEEE